MENFLNNENGLRMTDFCIPYLVSCLIDLYHFYCVFLVVN
jgi:hypothetical protein